MSAKFAASSRRQQPEMATFHFTLAPSPAAPGTIPPQISKKAALPGPYRRIFFRWSSTPEFISGAVPLREAQTKPLHHGGTEPRRRKNKMGPIRTADSWLDPKPEL